ncbi:unnamed protein product [Cylicocyclus nassatus]|uniref:Uncharacterized protein n=1 Tax=Cylicocyclus nassatus TaxID=53992 RepID=A0AA36GQY1_CYLNA|nr:unnamed protein product [Cylicocyclus nassatus]
MPKQCWLRRMKSSGIESLIYALFAFIFVTARSRLFRDGVQLYNNSKNSCSENFCVSEACLVEDMERNVEKWMVIVSRERLQYEIFREVESLHDWHVIIVSYNNPGANPTDVYWFNTADYNDTNSARNAAYIYAINKGAKYIYDLEDRVILGEESLKSFEYDEISSGLWYYVPSSSTTEQKIFNPNIYFGIPLIHSKTSTAYLKSQTYGNYLRLCHKINTPAVQFAVIHERLHVKSSNGKLEMDPSSFAPHVGLATGVYTSWHISNTLFHYNSFFILFAPSSTKSRADVVLWSYFIQKMLHLTGATIGFYPQIATLLSDNSTKKAQIWNTSPSANKMVEFLESWNCSESSSNLCIDMQLWKEVDVEALKLWLAELRKLAYKFPPLTKRNECSFNFDENVREQNCRPSYIDFSTSNTKFVPMRNLQLATQRIKIFESLKSWCKEADYLPSVQLSPSPSVIALSHSNNAALLTISNTVLVIINNYQRRSGVGLLQRLYQPYFALTLFCGTWHSDEYHDDGQFPEMMFPFNYIHVSPVEISRGVFSYYCLAKVRDLKLRNVRGYFIIADDAIFHFWHKLDLEEILYPIWVIEKRYPSAWWMTKYGFKAAQRTKSLFTRKYREDARVRHLWKCYEEGLLAEGHAEDAASHVGNDNGWTLSDFFYVPQKRIDYLAEALEIFYEADLFVELTMQKLLHTVPHNRMSPSTFAYVPLFERAHWQKYYRSDLVMIHPLKLNYFADLDNRTRFCETVVQSYGSALFGL